MNFQRRSQQQQNKLRRLKDALAKIIVEQEECMVCGEKVNEYTAAAVRCHHFGCRECLMAWAKAGAGTRCSCPVCRRAVRSLYMLHPGSSGGMRNISLRMTGNAQISGDEDLEFEEQSDRVVVRNARGVPMNSTPPEPNANLYNSATAAPLDHPQLPGAPVDLGTSIPSEPLPRNLDAADWARFSQVPNRPRLVPRARQPADFLRFVEHYTSLGPPRQVQAQPPWSNGVYPMPTPSAVHSAQQLAVLQNMQPGQPIPVLEPSLILQNQVVYHGIVNTRQNTALEPPYQSQNLPDFRPPHERPTWNQHFLPYTPRG
jgi:hypothetical protein